MMFSILAQTLKNIKIILFEAMATNQYVLMNDIVSHKKVTFMKMLWTTF